jgi:hypothetical protein
LSLAWAWLRDAMTSWSRVRIVREAEAADIGMALC